MADSTNETFELIITEKDIESADGQSFSLNELIKRSKNYEPQYVVFKREDEEPRRKDYSHKGENRNHAMLLLAFEIFERKLDELDEEELLHFPVCQFTGHKTVHEGIYRKKGDYPRTNSPTNYKEKFFTLPVFKGEHFAPIVFARECLKRYGEPGDQFVLTCHKNNGVAVTKDTYQEESSKQPTKHRKKYRNFSYKLINSKNMILRGAPGTGKTYLAKEIAADIISGGTKNYKDLDGEQKKQVEFVQFHPSYDYSDFVEGLRPKVNGDETMGFKLKDGIFKAFVARARSNHEASSKPEDANKYVFIIDEINRGDISKIFGELFFSIDPGYRGKAGEITTQYSNMHSDSDENDSDEKFYIPENVYIIGTMNDIDRSVDSFDFAMRRRFRFVELKAKECTEMLDSLENEDLKTEAIKRMETLNAEITKTGDLNENYQIGPAYFLKLKDIDGKDLNEKFNLLWEDYLQPLLQEYIRGFNNEKETMEGFEEAYGYKPSAEAGQGSEESNQKSEDK